MAALFSLLAAAALAADVGIVLGAGAPPEGWANPILVQRVCRGVRAYRDGEVKRLLMSGGYTSGHIAEAEMMRAVAVAAGVPAAEVSLEDAAVNTMENAAFSVLWAKSRRLRSALVVTHASHLPWAGETFGRAGGGYWTSLSTASADGTPPCLPAGRALPLSTTAEMLIVDVTEAEPFEAILDRPADVPSRALVEAVLSAASAYRAGAAKRLYFALPEPSTGTFSSGRGSARGHISRTELARVLASAAGVAFDDIYISSGRRMGQIPGSVEPADNPWLRIPGARVAIVSTPEQRAWWRAHFKTGLNALLPPPELLDR
ncbi:MAG: YdcF family protein [Elusimicrobia bacterium]|nr:YdcF family protein [Elusimicrobiota bacterium]